MKYQEISEWFHFFNYFVFGNILDLKEWEIWGTAENSISHSSPDNSNMANQDSPEATDVKWYTHMCFNHFCNYKIGNL